jgi:hypothetical protein
MAKVGTLANLDPVLGTIEAAPEVEPAEAIGPALLPTRPG